MAVALGCRPSPNSAFICSRGDLVTRLDTVKGGESGAEPDAGGFAALGVIIGQPGMALVGRVVHRNLPSQVRIPVPGGQLVQTHHNTYRRRDSPFWTRSPKSIPPTGRGVRSLSAPGV